MVKSKVGKSNKKIFFRYVMGSLLGVILLFTTARLSESLKTITNVRPTLNDWVVPLSPMVSDFVLELIAIGRNHRN